MAYRLRFKQLRAIQNSCLRPAFPTYLPSKYGKNVMLFSFPATAIDASGVLAGFSHFGAAVTIGMVVVCALLATRCKGRCREDEIFRLHVM
jgi:hypothetical protein